MFSFHSKFLFFFNTISLCVVFPFVVQVIAGQGFIVTGDPAEQMRLCAQLGSSARVEHQFLCRVRQEHLVLKQAIHMKTTAPPVALDITVKVGNRDCLI